MASETHKRSVSVGERSPDGGRSASKVKASASKPIRGRTGSDPGLGKIIRQLASITDQLTKLDARLDGRISAIETRMGSIDGRMSAIEARMGNIEGRMATFDERVNQLERRPEGSMVTAGAELPVTAPRAEGNMQDAIKKEVKKAVEQHIGVYAEEIRDTFAGAWTPHTGAPGFQRPGQYTSQNIIGPTEKKWPQQGYSLDDD